MEKADKKAKLEDLINRGFDNSYIRSPKCGGVIMVICSQCNALVINGVACHETGCPNQNQLRFDDLEEGV